MAKVEERILRQQKSISHYSEMLFLEERFEKSNLYEGRRRAFLGITMEVGPLATEGADQLSRPN